MYRVNKAVGEDPGLKGAGADTAGDGDEKAPLIDKTKAQFSSAPFTKILTTEDGFKLPQAIGHRGYKAKFPENTMASFRGAVEVGAHGLETDVHLTKDNVVVLSHDPTLKRCFDLPDKIIDLEWDYISTLRTKAKPHEKMPRLADLLEYMSEPANDHIWLLLDIKMDNNTDDVMRLIGETMSNTKPSPNRPWNDRVVLGIWSASFLPYCSKYLPTFPLSFIGISTSYARQFLQVPGLSFNMLHLSLIGPIGSSFLKTVQSQDRSVFAWTVNDEKRMQWGIERNLDGIVTDDPKKFLKVCKEWKKNPKTPTFTARELLKVVQMQVFMFLVGFYLRWKFGSKWNVSVESEFKRKSE